MRVVEELVVEHRVGEGRVRRAARREHQPSAGRERAMHLPENALVPLALDVEERVPRDRAVVGARTVDVYRKVLDPRADPLALRKSRARDREELLRLIDARHVMTAQEHVLRHRAARTAAEVEDARGRRESVEHRVQVAALAPVKRRARLIPLARNRVVRSAVDRAVDSAAGSAATDDFLAAGRAFIPPVGHSARAITRSV
jgi:hypothetical protein